MRYPKILGAAMLLLLVMVLLGCRQEGTIQGVALRETPSGPYTTFILRNDSGQDYFFAMPGHIKDLRRGDKALVSYDSEAAAVITEIDVLEDTDPAGYKRYRHIEMKYRPIAELKIIKSAAQ